MNSNRPDCVKLLIKKGAEINHRTSVRYLHILFQMTFDRIIFLTHDTSLGTYYSTYQISKIQRHRDCTTADR